MNTINAVASLLNRFIDAVRAYLMENAIAIGILLAVVYYFRTRYRNGRSSQGCLLSSPDLLSGLNTAKKKNSHQEEMRLVRQLQQQIADEHAKEAASKRNEKEARERHRKNHIAKNEESGIAGNRLGDGSYCSISAKTNVPNPMQPCTSNAPSYRPTRRNRGGA